MAQWVHRTRTDGSVIVQIKWRMDRRYQSESFTNVRLAAVPNGGRGGGKPVARGVGPRRGVAHRASSAAYASPAPEAHSRGGGDR